MLFFELIRGRKSTRSDIKVGLFWPASEMPHIHVVKLSQASVSDVEQADQGGFLGGHLLYIFFLLLPLSAF